MNINTKEYWEMRFATGDWELKKGRKQTIALAKSYVKRLGINKDFTGKILDFGCGLGDAIPIYKKNFPNATLIGMDISESAVRSAERNYGRIAQFYIGSHKEVLNVDIIIVSNVLEHIDNDRYFAIELLKRCKILFIIVPYEEEISKGGEHVNSYDGNYYSSCFDYEYEVFSSKGWPLFNKFQIAYHIFFKNLFRPLIGKKKIKIGKQILFKVKNLS